MLLTYYEKPSCTFYLVIAPRYFLEQSKQKIKELNQIVGSVNNCDVSKKKGLSTKKEELVCKASHVSYTKKQVIRNKL